MQESQRWDPQMPRLVIISAVSHSALLVAISVVGVCDQPRGPSKPLVSKPSTSWTLGSERGTRCESEGGSPAPLRTSRKDSIHSLAQRQPSS